MNAMLLADVQRVTVEEGHRLYEVTEWGELVLAALLFGGTIAMAYIVVMRVSDNPGGGRAFLLGAVIVIAMWTLLILGFQPVPEKTGFSPY